VVRYSHVMHLVSTVTGTLRPDIDAILAYRACLNMGTLTGAPKIRAMQLLREHEAAKRATYGGAVGYWAGDGSFDTAIVIRAALVVDGTAYVRAGAGVVHDSDPRAETDETRRKAQAVLTALAHAQAHAGVSTPHVAAVTDSAPAGRVVLIDNFDSFTFNLVDELRRLRYDVTVLRNDVRAEDALARARDAVLVLSPGPGTPADAGCCVSLSRMALGQVPLFGICLGHQALVEALGGQVAGAGEIVHGKKANVQHDGRGAFAGLPNPLPVGRYHSLVARRLPDELEACAHVDDLVMAVRHRQHRALGLQFHPESVLTTHGSRLLVQALAELRGA
jgi:anthranilate synthase/aminodeoxychorismate synthase-like glutamine amidotransferase